MPAWAAEAARRAAAQAARGPPSPTGKIAKIPSPMNFSTSPPKAWTAPAMRSNHPLSAAMTAAGGWLSESAVKPRRSA